MELNDTIIQVSDSDIKNYVPNGLNLFIEKKLEGKIGEKIILDYVKLGAMNFLYIPAVPKEIDEYEIINK